MTDMWKTRAPPVPLLFEGIKNGTFILRGKPAATITSDGTATPANSRNGHSTSTSATGPGLKDQKTLTLQDNLELFISRYGLGNQRCDAKYSYATVQIVLRLACKRAKK